jgi:hypothetical protein
VRDLLRVAVRIRSGRPRLLTDRQLRSDIVQPPIHPVAVALLAKQPEVVQRSAICVDVGIHGASG